MVSVDADIDVVMEITDTKTAGHNMEIVCYNGPTTSHVPRYGHLLNT